MIRIGMQTSIVCFGMTLHRLILCCSFFFCVCVSAGAQEIDQDSSIRFFGVPLVFFSSDTRWGGGVGGVFTFRGHTLRSSVNFSATYTQKKQWLASFPFVWFSRDGQWRAYGEAGWHNYSYRHFGIGNVYPDTFLENYRAEYPRLRLTATRSLIKRQSIGLRVHLEGYRIIEAEPDGEIATNKIPGAEGGFSSGLGVVWLLDSRDNQFFPHKGWFIETTLLAEHPLTFSEFRYLRFLADAAHYQLIGNKCVLAMQWFMQFTSGDPPFFQMPSLGGGRRLRGYPDQKYRDRHLMLLQSEFRFPIVWRFKGVVFAATGTVFGTPHERLHWRPNAGLGLRVEFDRKQRQHLRIDYGWGEFKGNSGFYLTFGEAF